jgi:hypothetical protein
LSIGIDRVLAFDDVQKATASSEQAVWQENSCPV